MIELMMTISNACEELIVKYVLLDIGLFSSHKNP